MRTECADEPPPATPKADRMQTARQSWHTAVAILSWVLFGLLWLLLYEQGKLTPEALRAGAGTVAVIAVTVAAVTLAWVRHNLGIHRRKGARKGRPSLHPRIDADRLDRRVRWEFPRGYADARKAGHVVIDGDGETKRYRSGAGA